MGKLLTSSCYWHERRIVQKMNVALHFATRICDGPPLGYGMLLWSATCESFAGQRDWKTNPGLRADLATRRDNGKRLYVIAGLGSHTLRHCMVCMRLIVELLVSNDQALLKVSQWFLERHVTLNIHQMWWNLSVLWLVWWLYWRTSLYAYEFHSIWPLR